MGQGLLCPLAQVGERYGRAGLEYNRCDDVFARLAGGHADGRDVEDAGH